MVVSYTWRFVSSFETCVAKLEYIMQCSAHLIAAMSWTSKEASVHESMVNCRDGHYPFPQPDLPELSFLLGAEGNRLIALIAVSSFPGKNYSTAFTEQSSSMSDLKVL